MGRKITPVQTGMALMGKTISVILVRRTRSSFEKCDTRGDGHHPDSWQVCRGLLGKANLRHATFRGTQLMHLPSVKLLVVVFFFPFAQTPLQNCYYSLHKDVLDTTEAVQD